MAFDRRSLFQAALALPILYPRRGAGAEILRRSIPATGRRLTAVGLGTRITFNVGGRSELRGDRAEVLRAFIAAGGQLIDSAAMYGDAQAVVGWCLKRLDASIDLMVTDKIAPSVDDARAQLTQTRRLWNVEAADLAYVHNGLRARAQLSVLREAKAEGLVRHIGLMTSRGRGHDELERIMRAEEIDVVQLTYNLIDREAEDRLLRLAADRGIAVVVNRPFGGRGLFYAVRGRPLPPWASDFDIANWAQFFLKFILGHPAVTCAVPATTRVGHVVENLGALYGALPDDRTRQEMVRYVQRS